MNEFERMRRNMLLYGSTPSYAILTDDTRIDFEAENTPIDNFCTFRTETSEIIINGASKKKNEFKEVYFGSSYSSTDEIPNYFLNYFTNLDTVDLSVFKNVSKINNNFLSETLITAITSDMFPKLEYIGNSFLSQCKKLKEVTISSAKLSSIGTYFLQGVEVQGSVTLISLDLSNIMSYFLHYAYLHRIYIYAITPPILESGFTGMDIGQFIYVPSQSVQLYRDAPVWKNQSTQIRGF